MVLRAKESIELAGPFFEKDPAKTIRANIRDLLEQLARRMEQDVRDHSPTGPTGNFREGITGRVASLSGRPWFLSAVVSQQHVYPWGERGTQGGPANARAQYRGGKLEAKYHMFRRTASRARGMREVLSAELVKGLE